MQDSTAEYNRGNDCCLVVHIKNELIGSLEPDVAASVKTLSGRCFVVGLDENNTRIWRQEPGPDGCHNVKELFLFSGEPHGVDGWLFHETFGIVKSDKSGSVPEPVAWVRGTLDGPDMSPVHVPYWTNKKKLPYDSSAITIMGSIEFYEMLLAQPREDLAGGAGDIGGGDMGGGGGGDSSAVGSGDGPVTKRAGWLERSADLIYAFRVND